jgi:hypothetical protein
VGAAVSGDASNPAIIDGLATGSLLGAGLAGWAGVDGMDGVDEVDGGDLSSADAGLAGWANGLIVAGAIAERTGAVSWITVTSG